MLVVPHWGVSVTPRFDKERRGAPFGAGAPLRGASGDRLERPRTLLQKCLDYLDNEHTVSTANFAWDPVKNVGNEAKHGLSLSSATTIWSGPIVTLPSKNPTESRQLAIGIIDGRHWTVVFTLRGDVIRLISARRSRENEKQIYEKTVR
jgi:uncharacterized DUF497 family protein